METVISRGSITGMGILTKKMRTNSNHMEGIVTSIFDTEYPCFFATTLNLGKNCNI
jgi:hypothetical protein